MSFQFYLIVNCLSERLFLEFIKVIIVMMMMMMMMMIMMMMMMMMMMMVMMMIMMMMLILETQMATLKINTWL